MSEELKKYRQIIDKADKSLMLALKQRFDAVDNISKIKKSANMPAIDLVRENQKNHNLLASYKSLNIPEDKSNYSFKFYFNIFRQIIISSVLNHNKNLKLIVENSLNNNNYLRCIYEFFGFEIQMIFKDSNEIIKLENKKDTLLVLNYNSPLWYANNVTSNFQVFIELPLCNNTGINKVLVAKNNFEETNIFDYLYLVNDNNNNKIAEITKVLQSDISEQSDKKIIGGSFTSPTD